VNAKAVAATVSLAGCLTIPHVLRPQTVDASARDALLNLLLFPASPEIDLKVYSPYVRIELQSYLRRHKAYRSKRSSPAKPRSVERMVYEAWIAYERKLAAVSADPEAPVLAEAYVDRLRPCYEWEGFHDCPESEAKFAAAYQQAYPDGPFSDYLPLLGAHRWLCAAEGYEYEKQPEGAARSRKAYEQTISTARQSGALMIRVAAERLAERDSCFPRH
jgi:hypothetical protein